MGIEALLTSQVIGLDAALTGKLSTSGGTVTGQLTVNSASNNVPLVAEYLSGTLNLGYYSSSNAESYIYDYANGSGLYLGNRGQFQFGIAASSGGSNHRVFLSSGCGLSWSSTASADFNAVELSLFRDAANTLAQRNSTNAQTFRLANTYTSSTSFENLQLQWSSNEARIGTSVGSAGGTLRSLALGSWNSAGTWRSAITITGSSGTEDTTLPNVSVTKNNSISGWVAINAIGGGSFYTGDANGASPGVFFVGTLINTSDVALTHRFAVDPVNNVVHIGGYRRAAAADGLLSASYAKGTDIAGSSLCIAGGRGTGTGAGGSVRIQTAPAGSTGTSLNALVDRLTIDSTGAATFSGQLTNALGTITASTPATFTQTWNNVATTFTGILANVTDTASASGSLLMDLQVGGSSIFNVRRAYIGGSKYDRAVVSIPQYSYFSSRLTGGFIGFGVDESTVNFAIDIGSTSGVRLISGGYLAWNNSTSNVPAGTNDLFLYRDAARTLAIRDGVNANVLNIYNTYTSSTSYERGKIAWESNVLKIGTEKGSAGGSARALELQTDGTTRLTVASTGPVTVNSGTLYFEDTNGYITRTSAGNTIMFAPSGGTVGANLSGTRLGIGSDTNTGGHTSNASLVLCNASSSAAQHTGLVTCSSRGGNTGAGHNLIVSAGFGSTLTTGSVGGDLSLRGGDSNGTGNNAGGAVSLFGGAATGNANGGSVKIDGGALAGSGSNGGLLIGSVRTTLTTFSDACNIAVGTTTGTKIGTATTQKIGFYDKTPVVQPTAVADATDAASVITQLNALLSRMRDLGLIAT